MASILIGDDDLDGSEAVATFLRRAGHRALCVPNGREALAMLTGAAPDLLILDVRMPEMDGVSFLEVLRSYLRWQHIPVVLMTGYPDGPDVDRATGLGAAKVFVKGAYHLKDLLACVQEQLDNRHLNHS